MEWKVCYNETNEEEREKQTYENGSRNDACTN